MDHLKVLLLVCLSIAAIVSGTNRAPAQAQRMSQLSDRKISAAEAYKQSFDKEIILLDIRRPDEWRESGIPATATPP